MSSTGSTPAVPLRSWLFDGTVFAAGVGSVVIAAAHFSPDQVPRPIALWLLTIPLITLLARYPLVVPRVTASIEVGLESAVLLYLNLQLSAPAALLFWAVGSTITQLANRRSWQTKMFNTGITILAGALAVSMMQLVGGTGTTSVRELLGSVCGALVFFASDYLLTAIAIAMMGETTFREIAWDGSVPLMLGCYAGVDSVAYLAALVGREKPWAMALAAVPMLAVITAAAAFTRAERSRLRMQALFDAATGAHTAETPDDVRTAVQDQGRVLVRSPQVMLRSQAPAGEELGIALAHASGADQWLVAMPRASGEKFSEEDQQALTALAAVTSESLSRVRAVTDLAHLAGHDPLTGLANRSLFVHQVQEALDASSTPPIVLLFCDLDGFKLINDSLGHQVGDELLAAVARRLQGAVRDGDVVARLGGDEFAVLAHSAEPAAEAERLAERLVHTLAEPFTLRELQLVVSASVGAAVPMPGEDASSLLRNSDVAMYEAKLSGKNRALLFSPVMLSDRTARALVQEELERALQRDELRVHYQPVVDLVSGRLTACEALVRWEHPQRGLLLPADFVGVAEETGLIADLGLRVLRQAHADMERLAQRLGRRLSICVNVSGRQVQDVRLEEAVRELAGSPHVTLVLEITERLFVSSRADTLALDRLRQAGARLAVDDFGTGYSSLAYLRELPVDVLKLDRAFVTELGDDPRAGGIVTAVLDMARTLGLDVVGEGIETPAQRFALMALGCSVGQGYHLARPMPYEALLEFADAAPVPAVTPGAS